MQFKLASDVCPKWMVIKHCNYKRDWNGAIIIIGALCMFIQLIISSVILIKLILSKKSIHKKPHMYISVCVILCALIRIPWWYMNSVVYFDNTPPAVAVQVLNRLSMLFLYLAQSFYLQTWLVLIFMLNAQVGRRPVQIIFVSFDVVVSCTILFCVVSRFWDTEVNPSGYGLLYQLSTQLIGIASLFTSILFITIGTIILIKLRNYYSSCSKTLISFIIISVLVFSAGISRFFSLFYKDFFGSYMNSDVFAVFCYFLPDVIPCAVITIMQIVIISKYKSQERVYESDEQLSLRNETYL
ncbi:Transmembrane_domain-containing protein [Hexamita inflata]|uniref:Transmembrane domain-containing protein n=1 Tax=Hexamita inflata TaxID=28002 RepID=A0AA86TML0_9EUKA|nr:Transmembrane domain-containing protein [Hexamita inflata]